MRDFISRNMADIWIFRLARLQGKTIISIERPDNWIVEQKHQHYDDAIVCQFEDCDQLHVEILNKYSIQGGYIWEKYK